MKGKFTLKNGKSFIYDNPVWQHYHLSPVGMGQDEDFDKLSKFLERVKQIVVENCEHKYEIKDWITDRMKKYVRCIYCGKHN